MNEKGWGWYVGAIRKVTRLVQINAIIITQTGWDTFRSWVLNWEVNMLNAEALFDNSMSRFSCEMVLLLARREKDFHLSVPLWSLHEFVLSQFFIEFHMCKHNKNKRKHKSPKITSTTYTLKTKMPFLTPLKEIWTNARITAGNSIRIFSPCHSGAPHSTEGNASEQVSRQILYKGFWFLKECTLSWPYLRILYDRFYNGT